MSLLSRELIADSIELVMRGHAYDALVGFAGCDMSTVGARSATRCAFRLHVGPDRRHADAQPTRSVDADAGRAG